MYVPEQNYHVLNSRSLRYKLYSQVRSPLSINTSSLTWSTLSTREITHKHTLTQYKDIATKGPPSYTEGLTVPVTQSLVPKPSALEMQLQIRTIIG